MKLSIPKNVSEQLQIAQEVCKKLAEISAADGNIHKFTLDGRFVGDIGEMLAAQKFEIAVHKKQKHCHDATCSIHNKEYGVQIKCRRKSTVIDFYSQPELLLVIEVDEGWKHWEIIYNGPGDILTRSGNFTLDAKGKIINGEKKGCRLHLDELRELANIQAASEPRVPERQPHSH